MKNKNIISMAALLIASGLAAHAQFTAGDLAVLRVGDGSAVLGNNAGPVSLMDLTTGGLVQSTINIPSGNNGLQISGSATSEGALVLNADGQSLTVAGYVPPYGGSGSLSGRSTANAPRGYVTVNSQGAVSSTTTLPGTTTYTGENIRSGFVSGTGSWFAGSGTSGTKGIVYSDGTTAASIQGANSRVLGYFGGSLYYSTGSGTGIYKYSGLPTTATTSTAFLTGVTGQGTSPYDFVLSPDGKTLYVADDGIGVQKFLFNGSAWTLAYNFTDGAPASKAYGLAVDFSGANPALYWTSPTDIWTATDTGSGTVGTSILSAGANYAFRGLDWSPSVAAVPEPSIMALSGAGVATLWWVRRRNRNK
jgi:PEP-CTERM motif